MRCRFGAAAAVLAACLVITAARRDVGPAQSLLPQPRLRADQDPHPTFSGYVPVDSDGSELFYLYWEAQKPRLDTTNAPVILWLQGGPGCASTFGAFYELGPYLIDDYKMKLTDNPGSWAWLHGLLIIDQPVGTGFSRAASPSHIPRDELGMATHLYTALSAIWSCHIQQLKGRPLIITGESYGGKYVPSIAHYILQAQDMHQHQHAHAHAHATSNEPEDTRSVRREALEAGESAAGAAAVSAAEAAAPMIAMPVPRGSGVSALLPESGGKLGVWRKLPQGLPPPIFKLAGIAIGNGLTDPHTQVPVMADTAHHMGLVPPALRREIESRSVEVLQLIDKQQWREAQDKREALRSYITNVTGIATMFDTRRHSEYDPGKRVDTFLNIPLVKRNLGAHPQIDYASCSDVVGDAMADDTMRSVKHLLPDILQHIPVLLYQGQFDILDGVASSLAWIESLDWPLQQQMADDKGGLWLHDGEVAGWTRRAGRLTHTVVYKAGHMVPHDQPGATQAMIEDWIKSATRSP